MEHQRSTGLPAPIPLSAREPLYERSNHAPHTPPDRARTTAGPAIARHVHAMGVSARPPSCPYHVHSGNILCWGFRTIRLGPDPCPDRSYVRRVVALDSRV